MEVVRVLVHKEILELDLLSQSQRCEAVACLPCSQSHGEGDAIGICDFDPGIRSH